MNVVFLEERPLVETNRNTLRVLLVEDHAAFRQALGVVLDAQPDLETAAQAASLTEGRQRLRASPVDVAVVDLDLPDGDGTELVGELIKAKPRVAVLALADRLDLERRALAGWAGAEEVLAKGAGLSEILAAIRRLGAHRR